ncbi:hypothetical protein IV203_016571 [Nitzschia inconspicua]|uniref:Uncharacterized protein n=1 Tax=Nitzschia inconspicua TaxID=303405 RepID=A0A9K3KQU7_9STRA|nr:hypothetical protein IV203_016571 [Nitzschia inconspicua]
MPQAQKTAVLLTSGNRSIAIVERQSQIVFLRLDPVLKSLLHDITALKELFESVSPSVDLVPDETWFRLVDSIVHHLDVLTRHFRNFGVEFAPSMILLADYVTLPLTAILHLQLPQRVQQNNSRVSTFRRSSGVQRSYLQRFLISTALAIQSYVEKCSIPIDYDSQSDAKRCPDTTATALGEKYLIKYLIALVTCLPTSSEVERYSSKTNGSDDAEGHREAGILLLSTRDSLDDGSDMWTIFLQATRYISCYCSEQELQKGWHGTLLVRLVDCTTAFFLSANDKKDARFVFTPRVQMAAVDQMKTLLQRTSNAKSFWRSVFPGVFSPLYKRIMNSAHPFENKSCQDNQYYRLILEQGSIESITLLLRITMTDNPPNHSNKMPEKEARSPVVNATLARNLSTMAFYANNKVAGAREGVILDESSRVSFVDQVKSRVSTPIVFILRKKALSRSEKTRKMVLSLCRVVLIETRCCWHPGNTVEEEGHGEMKIMEEIILEICIALKLDPDAEVSLCATSIADEYFRQISSIKNGIDQSNCWMNRRVVELIEGLPALLMKGKNIETALQLKKTTGYIKCLRSGLDKAIYVSSSFQRALSQLMDVDLEASGRARNISGVFEDLTNSAVGSRRMDPSLASLARTTIQALGESLGPKHAALFIDAVVSNFYEGVSHVPSSTHTHLAWLHEWIGSVVVARELLIGAFVLCKDEVNTSFSKKARKGRILRSLGSSMLPMIVRTALCPFSNRAINTREGSQECVLLMAKVKARISVLLLELVQTFCEILTPVDLDKEMSAILYPIVEMACESNFDLVRYAAKQVLASVGRTLERDGVDDLVRSELNHLVASMLGRLRLPGGMQNLSNNNSKDILAVANALRWTLQSVLKATVISDHEGKSANFPSLTDLMSLLQQKLDYLMYKKLLSDEDLEMLCKLHRSFFEYVLRSFAVPDNDSYVYRMCNSEFVSQQHWIETLHNFREVSTVEKVLGETGQRTDGEGECRHKRLEVSREDIELCSKLIARNCYLLSNPKLRIRIASCQGLISGFRFLAYVGSMHKDPNDEENAIKNSILRQVAASWPSVKARLRSLSEDIIASGGNSKRKLSLFLSTPPPSGILEPSNHASERIFLASSFDLIAFLCECSGDFLADRLKQTVFPIMAKWLRHYIEHRAPRSQCRTTETSSNTPESPLLGRDESLPTTLASKSSSTNDGLNWNESERKLFISIIHCLTRVMDQDECGKAMTSYLPNVGQMLLSFLDLDHDDEVVLYIMRCLKSILRIDSDAMLRSLLDLSGSGIPKCRIEFHGTEPDSVCGSWKKPSLVCGSNGDLATDQKQFDIRLGARCEELLSFAKSLPEQSLT